MSAEGATTAEHHGKDARRLHTAGMNPLTNASRLSRRDLIKGGACALAGSSGLANSFDSHEADSILKPFSFHASQRSLDDSRFRLKNTRFPEQATLPGWSEGRASGQPALAPGILADRIQLAPLRIDPERLPAIPHDDRWLRNPFHTCTISPLGRSAANHYARLA